MGKKTLILSQKQINEIIGGEFNYFSDLATTPDMGDINGTEVTVNGSVEGGYSEPTTTDKAASMMVNDYGGMYRTRGMGVSKMCEMSKKDWAAKNINEDNALAIGKTMTISPTDKQAMLNGGIASDSVGANAIKNGIKAENLPEYDHRFREAEAEAKAGDPTKLNNMGGQASADAIHRQYNKVKSTTGALRKSNSLEKAMGTSKINNTQKVSNGVVSNL